MSSGQGWVPVASAADLVAGHIAWAKVYGQELAIWRASSGAVNVWENRCPHRGVRLSIGAPIGEELRCQYHGWRFASGTGACNLIPAHPSLAPPTAIGVETWPVVELAGLVWTRSSPVTSPQKAPALSGAWLPLRPLPISRSSVVVEAALRGLELEDAEPTPVIVPPGEGWRGLAGSEPGGQRSVFLIQPVDEEGCVVRGLHLRTTDQPERSRLQILRSHDEALERLRRRLEQPNRARPC